MMWCSEQVSDAVSPGSSGSFERGCTVAGAQKSPVNEHRELAFCSIRLSKLPSSLFVSFSVTSRNSSGQIKVKDSTHLEHHSMAKT